MPLRDPVYPPFSRQHHWESFHDAWINTIVRHLNLRWLPSRYRADPQVHFGALVEADVATWDREPGVVTQPSNGSAVAVAPWAPPLPTQDLQVDLKDPDTFEVRVYDLERNSQLVAAVELVSPSNKDRAAKRQAFVAKCAGYLENEVSVIVIDIVSERRENLHQQLLRFLESTEAPTAAETALLYGVAYRPSRQQNRLHLQTWPESLTVATVLPTLPLWYTNSQAVPLELEATYEETLQVLRL